MAINFCKGKRINYTRQSLCSSGVDESELLEIPGIDPDKVERYGKRFLKLIGDTQRGYEDLMRQQEDRPQDPNHQNVIEISSDDEFADDGEFDDFEEKSSQEVRSSYFQTAPEVDAFNARCKWSRSPLATLSF